MTDQLAAIMKQSASAHDRFIQQNNELDQAYQAGTFGEFIGGDNDRDDVGTENSPNDLVGENR